jgi:hypothetical protein
LERRSGPDPERLLDKGAKTGTGRNDPLLLTPPELLDRHAALVPPPRAVTLVRYERPV